MVASRLPPTRLKHARVAPNSSIKFPIENIRLNTATGGHGGSCAHALTFQIGPESSTFSFEVDDVPGPDIVSVSSAELVSNLISLTLQLLAETAGSAAKRRMVVAAWAAVNFIVKD